jgi:hypothetical protein
MQVRRKLRPFSRPGFRLRRDRSNGGIGVWKAFTHRESATADRNLPSEDVMALTTISMIPSVFSVALKNVEGRIAFANQATTLPTGLTSRGQRLLPQPSRMPERYRVAATPHATWPADCRPGERSQCGLRKASLNRLSKPARG